MGTMKKLLIFAALAVAGWGIYKFLPPKESQSFSYQAVAVARGELSKSIQASGSVAPQNRVGLRPPFSGRLESVLVNEGDWVKKGQILAWLSSAERAALLDAAQTGGPAEVKKWEDLYKPTPMLSPISGTLIARNFEPGQGVSASDAVLVVSDRLIVRANVDETDIAQLKVGQAARLTLDAYPDQPVDARAVHIAYEAKTVNNVTIYEVEVGANKTPAFMRSGMTASVDFFTEKHPNVLIIPSEAIQPHKEGEGKRGGNAMADAANANLSVGAGSPRPASADAATGEGQHRWNGQRGEGREGGHGKGDGAGHGHRATVLVPGPAGKNGKAGDPVEKEIRVGMSDGKNTEVVEGLAEGDTVLLKTVALPSAAAAGKNPFMPQRTGQRPPRGAR
jgi:macrolide-specific efflux system membrane fusion protein